MQHCLDDILMEKAKCWEDSYTRKAGVRSKTFPGVAKAMATQWGAYVEKEITNS